MGDLFLADGGVIDNHYVVFPREKYLDERRELRLDRKEGAYVEYEFTYVSTSPETDALFSKNTYLMNLLYDSSANQIFENR